MGNAAARKALEYTIKRNHQDVLRILDEVADTRENADGE